MSDDDIREQLVHETKTNTARNLIWLGYVPHEEVAEITQLPKTEIDSLVVEVNNKKYDLMQQLRQILETAESEIPSEEQMRKMLFDAITIMNRLVYNRAMVQSEQADFHNLLNYADGNELLFMMGKLPHNDTDAEIIGNSMLYLNAQYAAMLRKHYDGDDEEVYL